MEVATRIRVVVREVFGSNKIVMIELFDERYAAITEYVDVVATATSLLQSLMGGDSM